MAVYTDVAFEELEDLLTGYDIGEAVSFRGIAEGVSNTNFHLVTDRGAFILTLYEQRTEAQDLPWFLALMEHLSTRGINCPLPVRDRAGNQILTLNGRPGAILTFLNGVSLRRPDAQACASAGAALARLHIAGADFAQRRANSLGPASWHELARATAARAGTVEDGLGGLIDHTLKMIDREWPGGLASGVIHADAFPDNVLFLPDGRGGHAVSGMIDFYFACNDSYAYDLAVLANAWCFEVDGGFNVTKCKAVLSAYRAARDLSRAEIDALPVLMRGAALRFLLTRLYDWLNQNPSALVRPKDPREFARRLRFHLQAKSAADYGL